MYCPGCHKKLDTSLTSCNRCGWQLGLGQSIPRAEHDRIVAEKDAEIARLREAAIPTDVLDPMDSEAWQREAPWGEFKSDLVLTVHHILTEPTCPTARVEFELDRCKARLNVAYHGNTIGEAIDAALAEALARLRAAREKP